MRLIVESSLKFRALIVVLTLSLVVFSVVRLGNVPMDLLPEYGPPMVRVQTEALGLSPAEVEQFITAPLEQDLLNGVAFLKKITSSSVPGVSVVDMEFEPGTDVFVARQVVQERLTQAHALPNVSSPPQMIQPVSSTGRVMMIGLTSKDVSLIDMSLLARWTIKARLIGVPGVSNVSIWGMRDHQLQIQVDPKDLRAENVSLRDLVATAANALWTSPLGFVEASTPGTGGWIENENQRLAIQHELPINTAADLARVVVSLPDDPMPAAATSTATGTEAAPETEAVQDLSREPLTIGDVATVVEDHQPLIGDASFDGQPGLMIVVEKFPWANAGDVIKGVEGALDELRPGLEGIKVDDKIYRPSDFLETSMDNLGTSVLIGAVLALLALIVLVWDWRAVVVNIITIPTALLGTVVVLAMLGHSANLVLLAGLAAGLVMMIDGAISYSHQVAGKVASRGAPASLAGRIASASTPAHSGMSYVIVILALALLPIALLTGATGALFKPIVGAFALAALVAVVVSLTVAPVVCWFLFRLFPGELRSSIAMENLRGAYKTVVGKVIQMRAGASFVAVGLAAIALLALPLVKQTQLVPTIQEPSLEIEFHAASGTSLPEMLRLSSEITAGLRGLPGISNVGVHVGRSLVGDHIVGVNSGQIWAVLSPAADYDATLAGIADVLAQTPAVTANMSAYSNKGVNAALTPPPADLVVRLYGPNPDVLLAESESVRKTVSEIAGVGELTTDLPQNVQSLEIKVKLDEAAKAGISPGDVRRTASILLSGLIVGQFFESQKVFDVVVWGKPEIRQDVESIRTLLIDTPSGEQVQLGDVADVTVVDRPEEIKREASSRYIDISANVTGRDIATVEAEVRSALRAMVLPYEYHASVHGTGATTRADQTRTISVVIASIIGVFLVLQAAVAGWRRALLLSVALLASMSGAMVAALLIGNLSLGVYAGLLAVLGLAAGQGMLMFRLVREDEDRPGAAFGADLVRRVANDRFAPVLTSCVALILFFGVFAVSGGTPGYVTLAPFAVVVVLGALSTLITNLLLLPALCLLSGPRAQTESMDATPVAHSEGATA